MIDWEFALDSPLRISDLVKHELQQLRHHFPADQSSQFIMASLAFELKILPISEDYLSLNLDNTLLFIIDNFYITNQNQRPSQVFETKFFRCTMIPRVNQCILKSKMFKAILLCFLLLNSLQEVVIIDSQLTPQKEYTEYTQKLIEMTATNKIQTKMMTLRGRPITCFIPVANHLLADNKSRESLQVQEVTTDRILPLRHLCAVYRTREFLYELCSGEYVRQFDDQTTIQNMGKKAPENIRMGNSNISQSLYKLGRKIINSVPRKYRYVVIKDRVGLTNYHMPFSRNKYGVDTINVTCQNGKTILSEILVVSPTQFVLTNENKGYCFSKVHHKTFDHGVFRIRLQQTSFMALGKILIGPCKAEQSYALVMKEKKEVVPLRIIERVNNITLVLDKRVEGKELQCLPFSSRKRVRSISQGIIAKTNGYVLKFDEDVELQEGDAVLISYTVMVDEQPLIQKRFIDFSFSNQIFLMNDPLTLGDLVKSAVTIYIVKLAEKQESDKIILDITKKPMSLNVTSSQTNETITINPPMMRIRLKLGQKIRLNSSEVYVVIQGQGNHVIFAKLTGDEWEYFVKGKPVKIKRHANGSKQIVKENSFYQNITFSGECFHVSQCIWAESDYAQFCRLKVQEYNQLTAMADIYVTVYNLSAPENAHLRNIRKNRSDNPGKILEVYDRGEHCGNPINADRITQVEYTCGDSWFTIKNVSQTKPCQYRLKVETQLLCQQSFQHNAKSDGTKQTICTARW